MFFGDTVNAKKLVGIVCAMAGIVWYTSTGVTAPQPPPQPEIKNVTDQVQHQPQQQA
jgi:drug/metabolite transporter (DMT)-like permease